MSDRETPTISKLDFVQEAFLVRSRGAPTRRKILNTLKDRALCYSDIASEMNVTVRTVSRQCDILEELGLIEQKRIAGMIMCHLTEKGLNVVHQLSLT